MEHTGTPGSTVSASPCPRNNKENKVTKISGVMGSGHSSSFLLSAESSAERMARKITEVANFDFREETLDSGKM